jgi:hypothetical protein
MIPANCGLGSKTMKTLAAGIKGTDDDCYGTERFRNVTRPMPVIVKDEQEKIITSGSTGLGKRPTEDSGVRCIFSFSIKNIPKSRFYSIGVGNRGAAVFSQQELDDRKWEVEFVLMRSR